MAMAELWESRLARNLRMLQRVKPSTDCDLDVKAYQKTIDEVQRGVTWGPKPVTSEMLRESVCLPRHGIYECHGEATELSVRVVDDGSLPRATSHAVQRRVTGRRTRTRWRRSAGS